MPVGSHALLGASNARRWLIYPSLARLEEEVKDRSSFYTGEGAIAHELAELYLTKRFKLLTAKAMDSRLKFFEQDHPYRDESMREYATAYCGLIEERIDQYESVTVELKQRIDFSKWAPEGFGISDTVVLSDKMIEIIDLRYGRGVPVNTYLNPQPMLCALGTVGRCDIIYESETM